MPTETFHHFSGLRKELREMIWEFSLPGPRRISPFIFSIGTPTEARHRSQKRNILRSVDPSALRVYSESREIALKHYQKREHYMSPNTSYIDFQIDTVCTVLKTFWEVCYDYPGLYPIDFNNAPLNVSGADLGKIQNLTLSLTLTLHSELVAATQLFLWCREWIDVFSSLKELTLEIYSEVDVQAKYPEYSRSMDWLQHHLVNVWREQIGVIAALKAREGLSWDPPNFRIDVHQ